MGSQWYRWNWLSGMWKGTGWCFGSIGQGDNVHLDPLRHTHLHHSTHFFRFTSLQTQSIVASFPPSLSEIYAYRAHRQFLQAFSLLSPFRSSPQATDSFEAKKTVGNANCKYLFIFIFYHSFIPTAIHWCGWTSFVKSIQFCVKQSPRKTVRCETEHNRFEIITTNEKSMNCRKRIARNGRRIWTKIFFFVLGILGLD